MKNIIKEVAILRRDILDNKFGVPVEIENHGTRYFASSSHVEYRYEGNNFYIKIENRTWAKASPHYFYFLAEEITPLEFILSKEPHHNHPTEVINEVVCWKANRDIQALFGPEGINFVTKLMELLGYNKNSELYRYLYRCLGYSLKGYYEVFYDELNNPEADLYSSPEKPFTLAYLPIPGLF